MKEHKSMEQIDEMERRIIEALGEAGALDAITRALDYDAKEDIYEYIMRCHDIGNGEE